MPTPVPPRAVVRRAARPLGYRGLAVVLLTTIVVGVLGACTTPSAGPPPSTELVVGATAIPPTLDATSNDAAAIPQVMLYNVYQTMVKLDSDGKLVGLLATEWTVSEDNLTYTFTLDPQATFAGGRAVTAQDVVWSMNRVKSSGVAVLKAQMAVVDTAKATDDHTVTVTLSKPSNAWLFNMSQTAGMVLDSTRTDFANATAGSGPYELESWTKGSDLVLRQRADYAGTTPHFTKVTFRYFSDPNAENAAMLSGGLDILSNLQAPQAIDQFADPSRFTVVDGTTNGEVVLSFNHQTKVMQDQRVRQAINYAIDRRALVDTVWNGKGALIGSMVPPTDPWYEDLSGTYPYDPAKARQLLADAGYASGELKLRLRLPTLPYATASGQFVASALTDVGIEVATDELEFPARWLDLVFTQADYDMSIIAHVEPRDIVKYGQPSYYWRYDNPEVQRLLAQADAGTADQQVTDMKKVAKILADDAAADWLFLLPNLVVTTTGVTGVPKNATGLSFDLSQIARS